MTSAIPDEAVRAAQEATEGGYGITDDYMLAALTAAAPFLQGVKVKALNWKEYEDEQGTPDRWDAVTVTDEYYFIGLRSDGYTVSFDYSDIGNFNTLEAAKAAAQADYEARILSAIAAAPSPRAQERCRDCDGYNCDDGCAYPDNPRAQALEEAARHLDDEATMSTARSETCSDDMFDEFCDRAEYFKEAASFVRALSSQPVADGWLPIETCPPEHVLFFGVDRHGDKVTAEGFKAVNGRLSVGNTDLKPFTFTHWRPLPASPGASATRPTGGSNHGE